MSNSSSHSERNQSAIIKTKLSDEKTIQAIQENPYMQYLLGLEKCTEKPVFVPEFLFLGTIAFNWGILSKFAKTRRRH